MIVSSLNFPTLAVVMGARGQSACCNSKIGANVDSQWRFAQHNGRLGVQLEPAHMMVSLLREHIHIITCMFVCTYVRMYVYLYIHIYIHVYTFTYTQSYV